MYFYLIDDDPRLLTTLEKGFSELGHDCETFQSSIKGLDAVLDSDRRAPDLLLLDVMMPELNGWELLANLRERGVLTPVIYLTARTDIDDRVRGLMLSADDYVIKPFALRELLARCEAVLRRARHAERFQFDDLIIYRNKPLAELGTERFELTSREHAFFELICSDPDHVFSRSELLKGLWNLEFDPQTNVVDVFVARLRRKLGPRGATYVETIIGNGYRIKARCKGEGS